MDSIIKILKEYKDLIKDNEFEELYNNLDPLQIPSVTKLFIDAGVIDEVLVNMDIIPDFMFYGLAIDKIVLPNNIIKVGDSAFSGCTSLTSITIPDSVTTIGEEAFYDCNKLTKIIIPDSVTKIGIWAFEGCTSLKSVTIGNSVTWIGSGAFFRCYRLTNIAIPDSVMVIGDAVFGDCHDLTKVKIPSKFKNKIRGIFRSKANEIKFTFT